jgi:hypothetical protein
MLGQNVDELKKVIAQSTGARNQWLAWAPTPVELNQVIAIINGKPVILAWDPAVNDWEVSAT